MAYHVTVLRDMNGERRFCVALELRSINEPPHYLLCRGIVDGEDRIILQRKLFADDQSMLGEFGNFVARDGWQDMDFAKEGLGEEQFWDACRRYSEY